MSSPAPRTPSLAEQFRRLLPYLIAIKQLAILSAALVLITPLIAASLLWSVKILVDDVLAAGRADLFTTFAAIYVTAAAAKIVVEYATQYVESNVVEQIILSLRSDLYAHILTLSPSSLGKHTPGDVLTHLQGDTNRTEYIIFSGPMAVLADGTAAIVFIGFLFYLSWQLTLCALIALPPIIWLVKNLAGPIRKASRLSRCAESQWMSLTEERLDAVPIIHAFSAQSREAKAFRTRCGKVRRMEVAALVLQARQSALVEAVVAVAGLGVLGLGAHLIASGTLTVGALVAFIGTISSLYAPVRALAKCSGRFQHAAAGAQRVLALLDKPSLVRERKGARSLDYVRGGIEFRDVHFSYLQTGQNVVRGLSLKIDAGETVAIVGPSGSGKSSLLRLLMRQYDCDKGKVLIDGADVRDVTLACLRRAIAPVFQDALILNGTIEKSIRYGAPGAPADRVADAARAAAVTGFASAKGGMMTPVGPRGSRLSGGQRQRIALARALLRDAPILLLDEATAGVDSKTEELIQDALDRLAGQHTIVVVAHRLSTVRRANRVVVVEDGRVVESGAPDTLLAANSRCRGLFGAQLVQREAAE